ncbi:DEAD/DEAH box helicase, partial [Cooperia oncophora]
LSCFTDLLPLDPLPVTTLRNKSFESIYNFAYFNPIQTQIFHCLYNTDENALIGAPTGSGKTLCAELAIFRLLQKYPGKKCVYIAPLKALVRERVSDWREKFEKKMGYRVVEVSGDYTPDVSTLNAAPIMITTPEKWDGITRSWQTREYVRKVNLIVIDEIHLLGVDRGAVLEAIITRCIYF